MKARKSLILLTIVVVAAALAFGATKAILERGLRDLAGTKIGAVDLGGLADGTYEGSCSVFPVSVKLKVNIKDHTITGIDLIEHRNGKGKPAEVLLAEAVVQQKIDLDVVAGATYSSKAIMKAMENALSSKPIPGRSGT